MTGSWNVSDKFNEHTTAVQSHFHPFHRACVCACVCVCQTFQWSPVKIIIIIIILGAARLFLLAAMWAGLLWHDMKPTCQEGKTYICHMSYSKILHSLFPPLHQFCYPFPRHTQIPEFTHITSVSRSDFEFLIPFSANAASEFCPTSENVSERNTQDPSFLSKTPPGAWDLRLSLCNRKDWRPNPPPSLYPATANSLRDMSNDTISSDLIALRSLCTKEAG